MMKTQITSNIGKVSARYKKMARNLPGVIDKATRDLVVDEAIPLFQNTVRTWQRQPRFVTRKVYHGYGVEVDPDKPWDWINQGTRVRYATMSKDWRSKTKPNVIASYNGAGRVLFVSRKHPRPGIQARNFTDIIMKRVQARAANRMRAALNEASYGAGVGI
jgi:hypothetical protein